MLRFPGYHSSCLFLSRAPLGHDLRPNRLCWIIPSSVCSLCPSLSSLSSFPPLLYHRIDRTYVPILIDRMHYPRGPAELLDL